MQKLPFLNRAKEIRQLRRAWGSGARRLAVVYGRRRCGKSRLLQHLMNAKTVYFLADRRDPELQRRALATEMSRLVPGFDSAEYPSWEALLESAGRAAPRGARLFLDEFPYLVQGSAELPSVLQKVLDRPGGARLPLVLCGSSQRMMRGMVLDAAEPLYGRADVILKVRPLQLGWLPEALGLDPVDSVEYYSVFGGVPRYWELARGYSSLRAAMTETVLDRDGVLHDEPVRLLADDLRSAVQPYSILSLIGAGCNRLSEIAGRLGKPAGSLARPVATLIELGYVHRETPFGQNPRSTKRTLYRLEDPFLAFYFRFVQPARSLLEVDAVGQVRRRIERGFSDHVGRIWEQLARQSVPQLRGGRSGWGVARRWWGAGTDGKPLEVDLVAESEDRKSLLVGEAKWRTLTNAAVEAGRLRRKAELLPFAAGRKIVPALWVRDVSGKARAAGVWVFTAREVVAMLK